VPLQVEASASTVQKMQKMLSEAVFIDAQTSALSGQLVAYNHPTEAFTSVSMQLQHGQQGTFQGRVRVRLASAGSYKLLSGDGWLRLFCDGFMLVFGCYTVGEAVRALQEKLVCVPTCAIVLATCSSLLVLPPALAVPYLLGCTTHALQ
jgi:hypothetical protein